MARIFLKKQLKQSENVIISGKYGCLYKVPNLRENIAFDLFVNGIYEKDILDLLDRLMPSNGCFLDIGANIGAILIPLCKRRTDITTLAVEAAPWIFEYLQFNVKLNNIPNARIRNNALFDQDDLQMSFYSPREKFGKGSLSPVFVSEGVQVTSRKVDTLLTESQLQKIDVIKADVEGFEYFIFKGAEALLSADDAPDIIFEFVDWAESNAQNLQPGAAQRYLLSMGYKLYLFQDGKMTPLHNALEKGAANIFATKKNSVLFTL